MQHGRWSSVGKDAHNKILKGEQDAKESPASQV